MAPKTRSPRPPLPEWWRRFAADARRAGDTIRKDRNGSYRWEMNPTRLAAIREAAAKRPAKTPQPPTEGVALTGDGRFLVSARLAEGPPSNRMRILEALAQVEGFGPLLLAAFEREAAAQAQRAAGRKRAERQKPHVDSKRKQLRDEFEEAQRRNPRISQRRCAELKGIDVKTLRAALGRSV